MSRVALLATGKYKEYVGAAMKSFIADKNHTDQKKDVHEYALFEHDAYHIVRLQDEADQRKVLELIAGCDKNGALVAGLLHTTMTFVGRKLGLIKESDRFLIVDEDTAAVEYLYAREGNNNWGDRAGSGSEVPSKFGSTRQDAHEHDATKYVGHKDRFGNNDDSTVGKKVFNTGIHPPHAKGDGYMNEKEA